MLMNLENENDVKQYQNDIKSDGSRGDEISFNAGANYVGLVSGQFVHSYEHWIKQPDGSTIHEPCLSILNKDRQGYDPENCGGCRIASDHYKKKKEDIQAGGTGEVENQRGNDARAKRIMVVFGRKGFLREIMKDGSTKISKIVSFNKTDDDGNVVEEVKPKPLKLTSKQSDLLMQIKDNPEYDHIKCGSDLLKYIINFFKDVEQASIPKFAPVIPKATKMGNSECKIDDSFKETMKKYFDFYDFVDKEYVEKVKEKLEKAYKEHFIFKKRETEIVNEDEVISEEEVSTEAEIVNETKEIKPGKQLTNEDVEVLEEPVDATVSESSGEVVIEEEDDIS